jgi:fermentation-respiration switch protein FrsA (DUF1100 family)
MRTAGAAGAGFVDVAAVVVALGILAFAALVARMKELEYFRPSMQFPLTVERYDEVNVGHLNGRLLRPSAGYSKIVLLCHGNGSNVAKEEWRMAGLRDLGYAVLAFDYSGYGKSGGVPSEKSMYRDASVMVALLLQKHEPSEIVVYGFSMGASVAAYVAARYAIPTLVMESPLSSMREVIKRRYGGIISLLCPEFDTAAHLAKFHGPGGPPGPPGPGGRRSRSLVMHGPEDEIVPYESVGKLIRMCTRHIQIRGTHERPVLPWDEIGAFIGGLTAR